MNKMFNIAIKENDVHTQVSYKINTYLNGDSF